MFVCVFVMKVLGLCSYPVEAAATRYRLTQFVEPLARKGIELDVRPFLDSAGFTAMYRTGGMLQKSQKVLASLFRRATESIKTSRYDLVFVQREAMFFGPPVFEWFALKLRKCPLVLDLDDATYVRYVSPTYGKIGSALKFFGKTDYLIKSSAAVICGNRYIADYVSEKGTKAVVIPTVVDTDKFRPTEKNSGNIPVIGWIGTHSTFPFLEKIFPALQKLAENRKFKLKIVGAGAVRNKDVTGLEVEWLDWSLQREIADFQSFDIGLYPMSVTDSANSDWLAGKSGFKAIQYMAVGIPFVVTPVGVCGEIGQDEVTHFSAVTESDWHEKLSVLLDDFALRQKMGNAGRHYALHHFTVEAQAEKLAEVLREAVNKN
jgi:glycosyltransferase involved in cell wall biosynthesis